MKMLLNKDYITNIKTNLKKLKVIKCVIIDFVS